MMYGSNGKLLSVTHPCELFVIFIFSLPAAWNPFFLSPDAAGRGGKKFLPLPLLKFAGLLGKYVRKKLPRDTAVL